jgi:capsular polysaccharide biosynthesis protein
MIKVNKLTNILTKCTKGNMYNNNTRFDLTRILKPRKVITVKPVLPSEEKSLEYIFEQTGYSVINLSYDYYNNNTDNEIIIGAFSLLNPTCYYHWLLNDFPRFFMCYNAGARLFVNNIKLPSNKFINETLSLFENKVRFISIKKLLNKYSNHSIKIIYPYLPDESRKNLYLDKSMNHFHIHKLTDYTKDIIPIHFNININNIPTHKIRIMRKCNREISNSKEVNEYLKKKGFQIIILEDITIKEQLQLIADSKIIFATHGSGIANCSVLSKNSLIIEVCPIHYYTNRKDTTKVHFHLLAEIVGCNYKYLMSNKDSSININDIEKCLSDYL